MKQQYFKHGMVYHTMINSYKKTWRIWCLTQGQGLLLTQMKLFVAIILKQGRDSGYGPHPYNHGKMSLDYICGPSLESQMTNLSPLPTNKVGCVYPEFFASFNILYYFVITV